MVLNHERSLQIARVASLVASTAISLACGTNYVYSAYAPQLAERLHLSATESNLIGLFGNLGMYLAGIPSGMLVDNRGPRLPILMGSAFLCMGYFPIHLTMRNGRGYMGVPALCFFSTLTGVGSCCSFGGALKMAALNWPHHRGTATAIPLAAFGLSAFFFSSLSSWLFPGNTADFLLLLSLATSGIILIGFFFCRIVPVKVPAKGTYATLPTADPDNTRLHRAKSVSRHSGRYYLFDEELGTSTVDRIRAGGSPSLVDSESICVSIPNPDPASDETSSRFSLSSTSSLIEATGDVGIGSSDRGGCIHRDDGSDNRSCHVDIRGWALVRSIDFWLLFTILGTFTGVGLMTINNVGHNAQALWSAFDPSKSPEFVQHRQNLHVSILSTCSFSGRILSGISSDILVKKHRIQRLWLVICSSVLFFFGQLSGLTVSNPNYLWLVSMFNGIGYGMLFGVFPTIVSEAFGVHGLSTNWGAMTAAAGLYGNILNLFYGRVYDDHSILKGDNMECTLGLKCYRNAYLISLLAVFVGVSATVVGIRRKNMMMAVDSKSAGAKA